MGSYEGVRETRESVAQTNFLTEAMRRGDFSGLAAIRDPLTGQPFPGNIIPAQRLDPKSVDMINKYQPLPNTTGPNNFIGTSLNTSPQDQFLTRIDHNFSRQHKMFAHYLLQDQRNSSVPVNPNFAREQPFRNQNVAAQFMSTLRDNVLNEVRYGYARGTQDNRSSLRDSDFSPITDLGINGWMIGGPTGRPQTGFETDSRQSTSRISEQPRPRWRPRQEHDPPDSRQSDLDSRQTRDESRFGCPLHDRRVPHGSTEPRTKVFTRDITGNAAAAFMLGLPKTAASPEGLPVSHVRQWRSGFYFQDDWQANSRLTCSISASATTSTRFSTTPSARLARCDSISILGASVRGPRLESVRTTWSINDHLHWAPRFGGGVPAQRQDRVRGG